MTYIVKKSDGTTLTTIAEGAIVTDACTLALWGRKAVNYGLYAAENFVKLQENFASDAAPAHPMRGQIWYEKTAKKLRVYDGTSWFTMVTITSDGAQTTGTQLISTAQSPLAPLVVASTVKVENLNADLLDGYNTSVTTVNSTIPVRNGSGDLFANKFQGIATSAQYADLAERFEASEPLSAGDIVMIGGDKEICKAEGDACIVGVISANPGFRMNEGAGDDETHPFVAYVGRVPVKVIGRVQKGQKLHLSDEKGVAVVGGLGGFVGIALENKDTDDFGSVMTVIGVK